jgi:hypothetical protein
MSDHLHIWQRAWITDEVEGRSYPGWVCPDCGQIQRAEGEDLWAWLKNIPVVKVWVYPSSKVVEEVPEEERGKVVR